MIQELELDLNGRPTRVRVEAERSLLSVLRDDLGLTGTKYGCGEGQCGACTVLLDGSPARACTTSVGASAGRTVVTIEGLTTEQALHPVQDAFLRCDALQCGYCTSGMIVSAVALLRQNPQPTREQIIAAMDGNVCRCGTYGRIVRGIEEAARDMRKEGA